jgi:glycosyltransferase involved in cell wall biosynthesis
MKITLITPTADQPLGMMLAEQYIARQTVGFHEWIVADDGTVPARLTMGQKHLVRKREHEGGRSLAGNMLAALPHVTGDIVVMIEHDDWYSPLHLATSLQRLQDAKATGNGFQRYYNVHVRCFRLMKNVGSALCNTAFTADLIPAMQQAAKAAFQQGGYGVDRLFWDSLTSGKDVHDIETVVGIKGLPGRPGLGMGHRPDKGWSLDPQLVTLREWIGDDVENYR